MSLVELMFVGSFGFLALAVISFTIYGFFKFKPIKRSSTDTTPSDEVIINPKAKRPIKGTRYYRSHPPRTRGKLATKIN